jgi:hypothetical protein
MAQQRALTRLCATIDGRELPSRHALFNWPFWWAHCYWVAMVKPCGRPAAITVGDADVTGEVTCAFPAESM